MGLSKFREGRPDKPECQAHVVSHEERRPRHLVLSGEFSFHIVSLVDVDVVPD